MRLDVLVVGSIAILSSPASAGEAELSTSIADQDDRTGGAARSAIKRLDANAPKSPAGLEHLREEVRELRESQAELRKALERLEAADKEASE